MKQAVLPSEIKNLIYHIRGKAVMLDSDGADLYKVETKGKEVRQGIRQKEGTEALTDKGTRLYCRREETACAPHDRF